MLGLKMDLMIMMLAIFKDLGPKKRVSDFGGAATAFAAACAAAALVVVVAVPLLAEEIHGRATMDLALASSWPAALSLLWCLLVVLLGLDLLQLVIVVLGLLEKLLALAGAAAVGRHLHHAAVRLEASLPHLLGVIGPKGGLS